MLEISTLEAFLYIHSTGKSHLGYGWPSMKAGDLSNRENSRGCFTEPAFELHHLLIGQLLFCSSS